MVWQTQMSVDWRTASMIRFDSKPTCGGRGDHTGSPQPGLRSQALAIYRDTLNVDLLNPAVYPNGHPQPFQRTLRARRKAVLKCVQNARAGLYQKNLRRRWIYPAELLLETEVGQLCDCAGQLNPRWPAADEDEMMPGTPPRPVLLICVIFVSWNQVAAYACRV